MAILQQVQEFATQAHGDQRRKYADEPYIQHPIRVMDLCRTVTDRLPILAAALLHDVLEDTAVGHDRLSTFLSGLMAPNEASETIQIVTELTDVYTKEAYPEWNRRVRKGKEIERLSGVSVDAQTIKYADITDNARDISSSGTDFAWKLLHEYRTLLLRIPHGDPVLYAKAIATVNEHLEAVEK
ncbi:MAG: bifunctional (p)ppGpp synthetase/guanosine-3',5'-bis(diphosphate) 3'-pyrophosphohydrolase [Chitinophagaceae bacterium]|nr:bifunctional (p)ppGpp synthetase/guanosine-3',5'-bis(diphosphate) 3'-pyrophosphohydrolase [Chitinophagaceae bacterium]